GMEGPAGTDASAWNSGPLLVDPLAMTVRWLALISGALLVMAVPSDAAPGNLSEYIAALLLATAGAMLTAVAGDLVLLFLGLELVSIPTYLLLLVARRDALGEEAGAKYFFLSLLASALFLYGLSFLYGIAGSTALADVRAALVARADGAGLPQLAPLALVLLIAGLGFRLAVVPFHFYAPDVFEGSTHPNAGFLSIVPKIVGVVGVVRLVVAAMPGTETLAWQVTLTLAVLTMTLGNVVALWQENVRRMLAYSSIAHAGYILIGLAVALGTAGGLETATGFNGVGAVLFYLCGYAFASIGTFAALAYLSQGGHTTERVEHLAGLARRQPTMAVVIALAMFSLAGIPPLAGFAGKFTLLASAVSIDSAGPNAAVVHNWFLALVTIALVNAAIAAAYYLRVVKVIFFDPAPAIVATEKGKMPEPRERSGLIAAVVCAVLMVGLGLFPRPLLEQTRWAGESIQMSPPAAAQSAPIQSASVPSSDVARRD
ncbi:MAG: NADH-quinone oxidoreductase subunit N, partial [Planctomycetales bacterium]|nr:NADH-quinone oxidoreductase subunit N [Planctomycetales bacterium]